MGRSNVESRGPTRIWHPDTKLGEMWMGLGMVQSEVNAPLPE